MPPPSAVVFDVFGTLFQLDPLAARLEGIGLPGTLKLWFSRTLRDAFALQLSGAYKSFREVAAGALDSLLAESGREADGKAIGTVLDGFKELPAYPDVKPALERLRERGVRVATLGNGSAEVVRALIERAGLMPLFDAVLSVEEAQHWKPHAAAYQFALRKLGVAAADAVLIAAHSWDVMGAQRAGLRGAFLRRQEKRFQKAMGEPQMAFDSLPALVEKLVS